MARLVKGGLIQCLNELNQRGARDDGGCNRLAFTDADKEGRDLRHRMDARARDERYRRRYR